MFLAPSAEERVWAEASDASGSTLMIGTFDAEPQAVRLRLLITGALKTSWIETGVEPSR